MGRLQPWRPLLRWGVGVGVAGLMAAGAGVAREAAVDIPLASLGHEARVVHRAIYAGGPFTFTKDGSIFGNRERLLPIEARGHYREYSVPTPGSRDRGARRIVCGGKVPTAPSACWYTADHYSSFTRIAKP